MIYMDHAATTPVKPAVLQAMLPYFTERFANASAVYDAARHTRAAIDCARAQVARLIGAQAEEIYFTSGGSESDNWALTGVLSASGPQKNHIITTEIEHHAILNTCETLGGPVSYVHPNGDGLVDPEDVRRAISQNTALISVMLANNEVGAIQPVREIARIAREQGVPVHTDAVQAVGHIPVDVRELGVDLLSISAHKFYGPKGIGALYIRKGLRVGRFISGGAQERGMRAGTENTAAIVGMGVAAQLAGESLAANMQKVTALRDELIGKVLSNVRGATVNALRAPRLPGHVHLTIDGADTAMLLMRLDMMGIAASAGSACTSGAVTRSHVLTAMGVTGEHQADLRLTLGESNTSEEIDRVVDALCTILGR